MEKGEDLAKLKTPPSGPHDLREFRQQCLAYQERHPWRYRALLSDGQEGKEIFRALSRIAAVNLGFERRNSLSTTAALLGIPFQDKFDEGSRRQELFLDFERFHGSRDEPHYISPGNMLRQHNAVYMRAMHLFGTYHAAMEAWRPGAYLESVKYRQRKFFPAKTLLGEARDELVALLDQHDYISREDLRKRFPDVYRLVYSAMRRNNFKHYTGFVERACNFKPPLEGEYNSIGHVGELFSFGYFHLRARAGEPIALLQQFPFYPELFPKIHLYAPKNTRSETGLTLPDIAYISEDPAIHVVEVKAGFSFGTASAQLMTDKYASDKKDPLRLWNAEDDTPVAFDTVHLHFTKDRIADGVLGQFREHGIVPVVADGFCAAFARHAELKDAYRLFVSKPLRFVRTKGSLGALEDLVLSITPRDVQESVLQARLRSQTT